MEPFLTSFTTSFVWGLAAFGLFVLILYQFAVKAVLAAVDAREARIARELQESEDAYKKAKGIKEELDARMRGAEAKIAELMAEARKDAAHHKDEMVEKGRQEIEALRVRSLRDIDAARYAAIVAVRAEIAQIAVTVAEKALRSNLDRAQKSLIDEALEAASQRKA